MDPNQQTQIAQTRTEPVPQQPVLPQPKKPFPKLLAIVIAFLCVLGISYAGVTLFKDAQDDKSAQKNIPTSSITLPSPTPSFDNTFEPNEIPDWKTYKSLYGEITFQYPPDWTFEGIQEYPGGPYPQNSNSVSFFNVNSQKKHTTVSELGNELAYFSIYTSSDPWQEILAEESRKGMVTKMSIMSMPAIKTASSFYLRFDGSENKVAYFRINEQSQINFLSQILSTFEFLDYSIETDANNNVLYTNSKYNFSLILLPQSEFRADESYETYLRFANYTKSNSDAPRAAKSGEYLMEIYLEDDNCKNLITENLSSQKVSKGIIHRGSGQAFGDAFGKPYYLCAELPGKDLRIAVYENSNGKIASNILSTFRFTN